VSVENGKFDIISFGRSHLNGWFLRSSWRSDGAVFSTLYSWNASSGRLPAYAAAIL